VVTARTRVGVLGGTFDPVHWGHLLIAEEARVHLGLTKVLFVPARDQWRKQGRGLSPAADRLAMVRLAIAGNPSFEASTVDLDREGATYTTDTLKDLSGDHDLYFIMGMDALLDLPHWRDPHRIAALAWLVAAVRPGYTLDWTEIEKRIPNARDRVLPLPVPEIGVSSTAIRERVAARKSIRYWLPAEVESYIERTGLYQPD
jgi:nicotinate-nucleotide adenylyltransferase